MRTPAMKGTFSAILGAIAIILIVFTAQSSLNMGKNNDTMTKMQAANETALKTENTLRALDKVSSQAFYDNLNTNCKANLSDPEMETALLNGMNGAITTITANYGITCSILDTNPGDFEANLTGGGKKLGVEGQLSCSKTIQGTAYAKTIEFEFEKDAQGPPSCSVEDKMSGCMEEPNFNCP